MRLLGLTGGIASGKSTVAAMWRELGGVVVDLDELAREVVKPGRPAYNKIRQTWGESVLLPNGELDRKKLGAIIFANAAERKKLDKITHPAVFRELLKLLILHWLRGVKCVLIDSPLLFESGLSKFVSKSIVVFVDDETQLKRLMRRDSSTKDEASQRISAQMPLSKKCKLADYVVDNNGSLEATRERVAALFNELHRETTLSLLTSRTAVAIFIVLALGVFVKATGIFSGH